MRFLKVRPPQPPQELKDLAFKPPYKPIYFLQVIPTYAPVKYRGNSTTRVTLSVVGPLLGLDGEKEMASLAEHDKLLQKRLHITTGIYWISCVTTMLVVILIISSMRVPIDFKRGWITTVRQIADSFLEPAVFAPTYLLMFLVVAAAIRLSAALTDRRFADSLAAASVINLLIDLSREGALRNVATRRAVLYRIHALSRSTVLLSLKYSAQSQETNQWVRQHFSALNTFIRDRERWAIAPRPETQEALLKDFSQLAPMYILGEFGLFSWNDSPPAVPVSTERSITRSVLIGSGRVLGFAIPLALLGSLLYSPDRLQAINVNPNIVGLVFMAWLLLAFDALLKLGIVASVVNLAKGLKELT
ncbi:MAG: hypothetical protein ABW277_07980 [Longimicrobiaceae bacterium]